MKPDARIADIIEALGGAEEYVRGIVGSFTEHSFDKEQSSFLVPAFTQIISYKSRAKPRPAGEEWFSMVEVIEKFSKTPFGVRAGVRRR